MIDFEAFPRRKAVFLIDKPEAHNGTKKDGIKKTWKKTVLHRLAGFGD